ncbi:MAG: LON peptidase substrate-binding domain-containing protein [Pseudomonadota bacterium]|nr:LON peptidase substrate-binding domain-containing protein [Pseudomonadota bacterium]
MGTAHIPLFPLKTVLFPGGALPLRVFEPRYLDMVSRCLREDIGFGVLLIRSGTEVGSVDTFKIGTVAEIVDWYQGSEGLLCIKAEGKYRFELEFLDRQLDGCYVGTIKAIEAEPEIPVPDKYRFLIRLLKKVIGELGDHYQNNLKNYADSAWVGHRLTEILPLPLEMKQSSLEMDDPIARLGLLTPYAEEKTA